MKSKEEIGREAGEMARCKTRELMEARNLGLDRGLAKLEQLLEATKPLPSAKRMVPDNQAQGSALDILLTLGDYYPMKKIKADVNHSGSIMAAVASHLSNGKDADKKPESVKKNGAETKRIGKHTAKDKAKKGSGKDKGKAKKVKRRAA